jgi:hypothetical protein
MYSNRRREHIHIIRQFEAKTEKYTGTRLVIFKKYGPKYIKDYDNFIKHQYKNPKSKIHGESLWIIKDTNLENIIKKEMINTNEEETLKMKHILYESSKMSISKYYKQVFEEEGLYVNNEVKDYLDLNC